MELKYVRSTDVTQAVDVMLEEGLDDTEMESVLGDFLPELNYQRSKEQGPILPIKAALSTTGRLVSDKPLGLTAFTPGRMLGLDTALEKVSDVASDALVNPDWERQTAEAAAGSMNILTEEGRKTWSAILAGQLPIMGEMILSRLAGKVIGGTIGGLVTGSAGALAGSPAGPAGAATGAAVTAPKGIIIGQQIGGLAAPMLMMSLNESANFLRTAKDAGIDTDIAQSFGGLVGVLSGGIEEVQQVARIAPFLKTKGEAGDVVRKKLADLMIKKNPSLTKFLAKEMGENVAEGIEEMVQGGVQHVGMRMAIKAMKKRYGEDWEPLYFADPDFVRDGLAGAGAAAVFRTGARVAAVPYRIRANIKKLQIESQEFGKEFIKDADAGKPGLLGSNSQQMSQEPTGVMDARRKVGEEGTQRAIVESNARKGELVSSWTQQGLLKLLSKAGVKEGPDGRPIGVQDIPTLRDLALSSFNLLKEGFQVVKDKMGRASVTFNSIISDYVPVGERKHHQRVHNTALRVDSKGTTVGTLASIWEKDAEARVKKQILASEIKETHSAKLGTLQQLKSGEKLLKSRLNQIAGKIRQAKTTADKQTLKAEFNATKTELVNTQELQKKTVKDANTRISVLKEKIKRAPTILPYQSLPLAFWAIRNKALKSIGLSDKIIEILNSIEKADNIKLNKNIDDKLTNTQHIKYVDALEGMLRDLTKQHIGKEALSHMNYAIWGQYRTPTVIDAEGKPVNLDAVGADDIHGRTPPRFSLIWRKLEPFMGKYQEWANRTGIRFMDMFFAVHERHRDYQVNVSKIAAAWESALTNVPTPWLRGKGRKLFHHGVSYLLMSNEERKSVSGQLGITHIKSTENLDSNIEALAAKLKEQMGLKESTDEIIKRMKETAEVGRIILDYPMKSGMLPFSIYRTNYVPLMREWAENKNREISFSDFLYSKFKTNTELQQLHDDPDTAQQYLKQMSHLGDSVRAMEERHGIPGEAVPFMEHRRQADLDFGKELGAMRTMDFEELLDVYFRHVLRHDHFGDIAPAVYTMLGKIDKTLPDTKAREQFKLDVADFLDAILGVPTEMTGVLRSVNLRSSRFMISSLIDHTMSAWNNGRLGRWIELPDKITPMDVVNNTLAGLYTLCLGITPLNINLTSPLKNIITQNAMSMSLGVTNYFEGLRMLAAAGISEGAEAAEFAKEIEGLNLRADRIPLPNSDELFGHTGAARQVALHMMSLFKASDDLNVRVAAATALVAWKRYEKAVLSADPKAINSARAVMDEYLLSGKGAKNLPDMSKIFDPKNSVKWEDEWKSNAPQNMRAISLELWDRIRKGNMDEAKRVYIQYAVNLSQWHYGAGGSPTLLRNPIIKMGAMFATWPLNYLQWNKFMLSSGLMRRWLATSLTQWLLAGLFSLFGYSTYRWLWLGALPDDVGPMGPIAQLLQDTYGALKSSGEVAQAHIIPTPSDQKDKAIKAAQRKWKTMLDRAPVVGHVRKIIAD